MVREVEPKSVEIFMAFSAKIFQSIQSPFRSPFIEWKLTYNSWLAKPIASCSNWFVDRIIQDKKSNPFSSSSSQLTPTLQNRIVTKRNPQKSENLKPFHHFRNSLSNVSQDFDSFSTAVASFKTIFFNHICFLQNPASSFFQLCDAFMTVAIALFTWPKAHWPATQ